MQERKKEIDVLLSVDVDAMAGWLGSYGDGKSLMDLSMGEFAGRVGTQRLLDLFAELKIKTTWFIPGHSIETFWNEMKRVVDAGHEIASHGYSHENTARLTREQEEKILVKSVELIQKLSGKKPRGYRTPWMDFSPNTIELLIKHGFVYNADLCAEEFNPYFVRTGDKWYPIEYSNDPDTWMKPYEFGEQTKLVEIPLSLYLDDLPPMMPIPKKEFYNYGYTSPQVMYGIYKDYFDYLYQRIGKGVYSLGIHPDVSARPHVILMLEKLLRYIKRHRGVRFRTCEAVAAEFLEKASRNSG